MAATPADAAKYTNDGVPIYTDAVAGAAIRAAHPDAIDGTQNEIEMYFVDPNQALAMLNEQFAIRSSIGPPHVSVEVEESLDLATVTPIAPTIPSYRAIDDTANLDSTLRTLSFAHDCSGDRFSVDLML